MTSVFTPLYNLLMRSHKTHCGRILVSPWLITLIFYLFIYFFLSYNNCSSCLKTTFPCVDQWFKLFYLYRPWIKTKCVVEILRNLNWLKSVSNRVKTNSSYLDLKILFFISLCELITWIIKGLWGSRMLPQNGTQKTSSLHSSLACEQSCRHKGRYKMTEPTHEDSSTEQEGTIQDTS